MKGIRTIFLIIILVFVVVQALWSYTRWTQRPSTASEKILNIVNNAVSSLDPIQCIDDSGHRELAKVYEGLLEYHYLKRPYELGPNLAAEMPTISADQLVYTFKLKEGVQFHDNPCFPEGRGREFTAQDVVYSLKRLADPKNQAKGFWVMDGQIQGLNEWREKYANAPAADYTEDIPGLQAIDQYTIQFRLTQPNPRFLNLLAMPNCYVVAQEAVEYYGAEFVNHPVGTGPFTLKAFHPQDSKIVYHRNPTFRDKRFPSEAAPDYQHMLVDYANQKLPFIDTINVHILPEAQTGNLMFKKGRIDVIGVPSGGDISGILENGKLTPTCREQGMGLYTVKVIGTTCIVINNAHPLFKNNPKLRQAMSLAFDRNKYNQLFYKGEATMAQSIIPSGLAGYSDNYTNPHCEYNVEKAKQSLAEAGYPGGQELPIIKLDIGPGTIANQQAELFQQCMKVIGIRVEIVTNTWPGLLSKVHQKTTMLHDIGMSASCPDAADFFQAFYSSSNSVGIGANFNNKSFNEIYEQAVAMLDSPERTSLYEKLNQMIGKSVPVIFILHPTGFALYQRWIKNYLRTAFHYGTEQYWDVVDRSKE